MKQRPLVRSFAGGEITPELFARLDLSKYQTGLALCSNFWVLPHGPAQNRPGLAYVLEVRDSTQTARLIPFAYNTAQTFALEFNGSFIRFHTQGGTLLEAAKNITAITNANPAKLTIAAHGYTTGQWAQLAGITGITALNGRFVKVTVVDANNVTIAAPDGTGIDTTFSPGFGGAGNAARVYEIASPYAAADLFDLHYTQSADVLTLVHPGYAPRELRRLGATNWTLTAISFVPTVLAPTSVTATPTGAGATSYSYVVTSVTQTGFEESTASTPAATCTNDLTLAGHSNAVTWAAATGAIRYNVYKLQNGLYGYIGQTDGLTFTDGNITADVSSTPPLLNNPFTTDWPGAVGYFEQRRIFAGTPLKPQNVWMTKSATESNLQYSIPTRDSDSIGFRVTSHDANTIRHIVALPVLVMLTSGGEWDVVTANSDVMTPASVKPVQQDAQGANNAQPLVVGKQVIYAQAAGCRVRQLSYTWQSQGYVSEDLSVMAPHLTDTYTITDMAYRKAPYKMGWFVRSDGVLLGLTYLPEQQVVGWHQHGTQGAFESVCAVAESGETALYTVVKRTINARTVRYVERLASRVIATPADAFFVDSGTTYSGAPAATLSGLWHLIGQTVSVLGDAAVYPPQVVAADGTITLPHTVSKAQIGLPITARLQLLPLAYEAAPAFGSGYMQNVNKAWLRLFQSSGVWVGPSFDKLYPMKQRTTEPYDSPPALLSGVYEFTVEPKWGLDATVCIQQQDPLPVTLQAVTLDVAANP